MPNYKNFLQSLPEAEREELVAQRRSGDGKVYLAPVYGTQKITGLRTWMYRKDIFEKNHIAVPQTMEQIYQASKQLKNIYPDSYPLCFRTGLEQLDVMGPAWANDFCRGVYYDFKEKEWKFGSEQPTMLDIVDFFHKMSADKLIPPDFLTIEPKSWEALIFGNRGFIMPEYLVRIDFFNIPARQENPDFTFAVMVPPKADTPSGQAKIAKLNLDPSGYVLCNTKDTVRIQNAVKLLDWMYSDQGSELLSWGKENQTYRVVNAEREFIIEDGGSAQQAYGIATYGLYQRIDPVAYAASYTKEQIQQGDKAYTYTEPFVNPVKWLAFDDEELQVRRQYYDALINFNDEQLSKFLLGQRPMTEWDTFQKELKEMNVDGILDIFRSAYSRAMGQE